MSRTGEAFDPKLAAAVQAHQQGRLEDAERLYQGVLRRRPNDGVALGNLGVLYEQSGRIPEAIEVYQKAAEADPRDPDRRLRIGNLFRGLGRAEEALAAYQEAVRASGNQLTHHLVGDALSHLGRHAEAAESFQKSSRLNPLDAVVMAKLASALSRSGRFGEAIEAAKKAVANSGGSGFTWLNLGDVLVSAGQWSEAEEAYRTGLQKLPQDVDGHFGLTEALLSLGRPGEALSTAQSTERLAPHHPRAAFDLGRTHQALKQNDLAISAYRRALTLAPNRPEVRFNLAVALGEQGYLDEAQAEFSAVAGPLEPSARIRQALLAPVIPGSVAEIEASRAATLHAIETLQGQGLVVQDPERGIGVPGFFFAYQGRDNRDLLVKIARLMTEVVPDLAWTSPHLADPRPPTGRIRVGFLSIHLREHTVGRITSGLIQHLDRTRFEVVVLHPPSIRDDYAEIIEGLADQVVVLPGDFRRAREVVADQRLDAIYFPDIGMDPFTYFLAFSRLAPVQCAGWGHADTTGIPTIDWFVSCRAFETAGAEERYSERLILLDRMNNYYERPPQIYEPVTRSELGLGEEGPLYLCPQSAFKLHPDFDEALKRLLDLDPRGVVALSAGVEGHWTDRLRARFRRTMPEHHTRLVFIPRVSPAKFRGLLALADVILDPKHFTGGHTSYMAFSVGTPIVTWNGEHLRSRMTAGLYELMGASGPVASDAQEFARMAFEIANDPARRHRLSAEILDAAPRLFEDIEAVRGFERFLESVCGP